MPDKGWGTGYLPGFSSCMLVEWIEVVASLKRTILLYVRPRVAWGGGVRVRGAGVVVVGARKKGDLACVQGSLYKS